MKSRFELTIPAGHVMTPNPEKGRIILRNVGLIVMDTQLGMSGEYLRQQEQGK